MQTYRINESTCPWCERTFDSASGMGDEPAPSKGDLTVCINCASLLEFDEDLIPQKISESEQKQILAQQPGLQTTINRYQRLIRQLDRRE